MDAFLLLPNDPWKAREYEIDVKRWKEIEIEAGKAMDAEQYHYASRWYEKIFKELQKDQRGQDDPNLMWLKRHYSEALMQVGSFEVADRLQEEVLKSIPAVALDANGDASLDPGNLIHDILYLRIMRASQLLDAASIAEAGKAVSILEAALVKSRTVFGTTHETTRAIRKSRDNSERFKFDLQQRQKRKEEESPLKAETELQDVTIAVNSSDGSDSVSETDSIEVSQLSPAVDRTISMRYAQQRPRTVQIVDSEESTLSDAQVLSGTIDEHKVTDRWFTYLKKTHDLLETTTVGRPRVRIAILDTGLNRNHPNVKKLLEASGDDKRIKKCKSWVAGVVGTDKTDKKGLLLADEDDDGHGTHCAMVAHKVAPDADIYVARVFKDRKSVRGDHIIKAINWAVQNEVDVISMSFALSENDTALTKKIWNAIDAVRYKVLMFAAASNDGLNAGRKFPARHPDVFCIHSASGAGNHSQKLNPGPWRNDFNYTALGEHVEAPSSGDTTLRVSGTSVAAPVAAGIAALVLGFTRQDLVHQQEPIEDVEKLKTKAGMDMVFAKMVDPNPSTVNTELYVNIQPWQWMAHNVLKDSMATRARRSIAHDINEQIEKVHHPGLEPVGDDSKLQIIRQLGMEKCVTRLFSS